MGELTVLLVPSDAAEKAMDSERSLTIVPPIRSTKGDAHVEALIRCQSRSCAALRLRVAIGRVMLCAGLLTLR